MVAERGLRGFSVQKRQQWTSADFGSDILDHLVFLRPGCMRGHSPDCFAQWPACCLACAQWLPWCVHSDFPGACTVTSFVLGGHYCMTGMIAPAEGCLPAVPNWSFRDLQWANCIFSDLCDLQQTDCYAWIHLTWTAASASVSVSCSGLPFTGPAAISSACSDLHWPAATGIELQHMHMRTGDMFTVLFHELYLLLLKFLFCLH